MKYSLIMFEPTVTTAHLVDEATTISYPLGTPYKDIRKALTERGYRHRATLADDGTRKVQVWTSDK